MDRRHLAGLKQLQTNSQIFENVGFEKVSLVWQPTPFFRDSMLQHGSTAYLLLCSEKELQLLRYCTRGSAAGCGDVCFLLGGYSSAAGAVTWKAGTAKDFLILTDAPLQRDLLYSTPTSYTRCCIYIYISSVQERRHVRRSCWSSLIKMRLYRLYKDGKERKVKREEGYYILLCRKRRELAYERSEGGHQNTRWRAGVCPPLFSVQEWKGKHCMVCTWHEDIEMRWMNYAFVCVRMCFKWRAEVVLNSQIQDKERNNTVVAYCYY